MMTEQIFLATSTLLGLLILAVAMLRGWQGWLALRHREIDLRAAPDGAEQGYAASRIDLADLRERVRRLEAIAAGVDP